MAAYEFYQFFVKFSLLDNEMDGSYYFCLLIPIE